MKKKGFFWKFLLFVVVLFGAYKALEHIRPPFFIPIQNRVRLVTSAVSGQVRGIRTSIKETIDNWGKERYVGFEFAGLELSDMEPVDVEIVYLGKPKEVEYSVDGSSVQIVDKGFDGVTVIPVEEGKSTIQVSASDGRVGTCDVTVALQHDVFDLIENGDLRITIKCDHIDHGTVTLWNFTDRLLSFIVPTGTYMNAAGGDCQNMMIVTEIVDKLYSGSHKDYSVDTCCMNIHRAIPTKKDEFSLSVTEDETLKALVSYFRENSDIEYDVRQAAIWIVTDSASFSDCGTLADSAGLRIINQDEYDSAKEIVNRIRDGLREAESGDSNTEEGSRKTDDQTDGGMTESPESLTEGDTIKTDEDEPTIESGSDNSTVFEYTVSEGSSAPDFTLSIPAESGYYVDKDENGLPCLKKNEDNFIMTQSFMTDRNTFDGVKEIYQSIAFAALKHDSLQLAGYDTEMLAFKQLETNGYSAVYFIVTDDDDFAAWFFTLTGDTMESVSGDAVFGILGSLKRR